MLPWANLVGRDHGGDEGTSVGVQPRRGSYDGAFDGGVDLLLVHCETKRRLQLVVDLLICSVSNADYGWQADCDRRKAQPVAVSREFV
jgi:hypothetical protein